MIDLRLSACTVAVCLGATFAAAPAASASSGALAELPGQAGCVSNSAYGGSSGQCVQGSGLRLVQSLAVSPDGRSLYTAAVQSNAIAAFSRDATTGLLTQVPGSGGCVQDASATHEPGCVTGRALQIPDWVMVSPDGNSVYATSFTSQAIDVFGRDATTGGLSQLSGGAGCVSSSTSPGSCSSALGLSGIGNLQISPDGKSAYAASFGNGLGSTGGIAAFARASDGSLTQLGAGAGCIVDSTATASGCTLSSDSSLRGAAATAISPDGQFVYVAARYSEAVTVYQRNLATGALVRVAGANGCVQESGTSPCSAGTPARGLQGPNSISISPDGSVVYVSSFTAGQGSPGDTLAVFSRNTTTGALTQLPGAQGCFSGGGADATCTSIPVLGGNFAVTTSPDGSYVYDTAYQSNAISMFSSGSGGALTPLPGPAACVSNDGSGGQCATGATLAQPHELAVSPDGNFAYVAAHQNSAIDIFATASAASSAPGNTSAPVVSGTPAAGQALSASAGAWNAAQSGYSFQWLDCDAAGANCAPISGATNYAPSPTGTSSYTPSASEAGRTLRVAVTTTNSAGSSTATSAPTAAVPGQPPANTALPAITGTVVQGQRLSATSGSWSQNPTGYRYQWNGCNTAGAACSPIAGAITASYTLSTGDVGHRISVTVTASNAAGSTAATSAATATVTAPPPPTPAPRDLTAPTVTGKAALGHSLTARPGTWSAGSSATFRYRWLDCNRLGATCSAIPGASASTYTLRARDVNHTIMVVVTVVNAGGSANAASRATAVVTGVRQILACQRAMSAKSKRGTSNKAALRCQLRKPKGNPSGGSGTQATVLRGHTVFGAGTAISSGPGRWQIAIIDVLRRLKPGQYTIKLTSRHGSKLITQRLSIVIA